MAREPLIVSLDGWTRLCVEMGSEELLALGPTTPATMLDGSLPLPVTVQFDTGANISCISAQLGAIMREQTGSTWLAPAGQKPQNVPTFRGVLAFESGTQIDANFAVLSHLKEPHDVLIGRDILKLCRVLVDFTAGRFEIHFKHPDTSA